MKTDYVWLACFIVITLVGLWSDIYLFLFGVIGTIIFSNVLRGE